MRRPLLIRNKWIFIQCEITRIRVNLRNHQYSKIRDYVRGGGAEGALAPLEFEGSVKRTERETDNLLSLAPPESKS